MIYYKTKTDKIIQACINVHNELGNGFLEPVYQSALEIEFKNLNIPYKREVKIEVSYKGVKLDTVYYADFVCYDKIIIELKSVNMLVKAHKAQVLNYLYATGFQIGYLINFGENSLKWDRITKLNDYSKRER